MKRREFLKLAALGAGTIVSPGMVLAGEEQRSEIGRKKLGETENGVPRQMKDAESFVVLPDTQNYARLFPDLFECQTKWIVDNREKYNIRFVLHEGDVTENNNTPQWDVAKTAMSRLDGKVPYAICLGNHDIGEEGKSGTRDSLFGEYFPLDYWKAQPTFGGVYDKETDRPDNSFHLFKTGDIEWLVLALEFGPRDDVLRWANEVVGDHPKRAAILLTHAYLTYQSRYDTDAFGLQGGTPHRYQCAKSELGRKEGCNDGGQMWRKLVSKHKNFRLVFSGHTELVAKLDDKGVGGNTVHQYLADYQFCSNGGDTWMRLVQVSGDGKKLWTTDFAPQLGEIHTDEAATFCSEFLPVNGLSGLRGRPSRELVQQLR